jgi:alkyl sulfatase BDS1-like metallo-beta-lactamase superfamily hydrolase
MEEIMDNNEMPKGLQDSYNFEMRNAQKGLLNNYYAETEGYSLTKHENMISDNRKGQPDTVHPNLWGHFKLNMKCGLYRVNGAKDSEKMDNGYSVKAGDVFQIRGNDLANMTIVWSGNGWIVMDTLTTSGVANAVWKEIVQLAWANYLDQTLKMFPNVETLCSSHNWPRFGNDEYKRYINLQMDMYRFIHNATLYLANLGYTIFTRFPLDFPIMTPRPNLVAADYDDPKAASGQDSAGGQNEQ